LASYEPVTPSASQARRATDASKLTFPLPLMITIIGGVIALLLMINSVRMATDSIQTQLSAREKLDAKQAELDKERVDNLRKEIEALREQIKATQDQNQILGMKFDKWHEQELLKESDNGKRR